MQAASPHRPVSNKFKSPAHSAAVAHRPTTKQKHNTTKAQNRMRSEIRCAMHHPNSHAVHRNSRYTSDRYHTTRQFPVRRSPQYTYHQTRRPQPTQPPKQNTNTHDRNTYQTSSQCSRMRHTLYSVNAKLQIMQHTGFCMPCICFRAQNKPRTPLPQDPLQAKETLLLLEKKNVCRLVLDLLFLVPGCRRHQKRPRQATER